MDQSSVSPRRIVSASTKAACGTGRFSRGGALSNAAGRVVVRAVARAEPTAEIAGAVTQGHAAEMGADTLHHEPFAGVLALKRGERPVGICRVGIVADIGVPRIVIGQFVQFNGPGCVDLFGGATADEHRLSEKQDRDLRALGNARYVNAHGRGRARIRRRVHLVHQRPNRCTGDDNTCAAGGVKEEIAALAVVIFCMGHWASLLALPRQFVAHRIWLRKPERHLGGF